MSDNWNLIKQEVGTYRNYVKGLPHAAQSAASYCFLLTKEEFERMLALKGHGTLLDGVRIYLSAKEIEGHLVPSIVVVAVEKDGGSYNDYGVPKETPPTAAAPMMASAAAPAGGGSTGNLPPCPNICSDNNVFNS